MKEEFVTVSYGEEKYAPVAFNVVSVGPFSLTTRIREGETVQTALERARKTLEQFAVKATEEKVKNLASPRLEMRLAENPRVIPKNTALRSRLRRF